jgi:hypothetical protein
LLKKKFSILRILLAGLIGLLLLGYVMLMIPGVQNYLGNIVASRIANTLGTDVKVGRVGFSLFDKIDIENLLIKDQSKDTLLFARYFKLSMSDLFFSSNTPTIKYIGLDKATIYINSNTEKWNYQFVVDYLNKDTSNSKGGNKIDLKKIDITNIHLVQTDSWIGDKMELKADNILLNIKSTLGNNIIIDQIKLNKPFYLLEQIQALKPTQTDSLVNTPHGLNTAVNNAHTSITLNELKVINGKVWIEYGNKNPETYFEHYPEVDELNSFIELLNLLKGEFDELKK